MIIRTWNETDKVRYCIDVEQLCNGKQSPLFREWVLSGGKLSVRKCCTEPVQCILVEWHFPLSHFVEISAAEPGTALLVYTTIKDNPPAFRRLDTIAHDTTMHSLYCRAKHGTILIIEGPAFFVSTAVNTALPCCSDSRRQLDELSLKPWPYEDHRSWLKQKWEWLSASLLHETREGCRHFPLAAAHREKIKRVAEKIYQDPACNDTIAQLAKAAGISGTYLKKFFMQYYGQSILQFRQHYRMQASCRLLSNKTIALQDIALACGFQDDSNFVRAFQRYFGVSPVRGMR